jgi:hypothetical protein
MNNGECRQLYPPAQSLTFNNLASAYLEDQRPVPVVAAVELSVPVHAVQPARVMHAHRAPNNRYIPIANGNIFVPQPRSRCHPCVLLLGPLHLGFSEGDWRWKQYRKEKCTED